MPVAVVQESQVFKALHNNRADLEKFRAMIMQEYVLKANVMNVKAKQTIYYATICKLVWGLDQAFIVQHKIYNFNKDVAVLDLIADNQDNILVLLGIPFPKFLAAYKVAHNLQGIPTPTINFNFQDKLDRINGTAPLKAEEAPAAEQHQIMVMTFLRAKMMRKKSKRWLMQQMLPKQQQL